MQLRTIQHHQSFSTSIFHRSPNTPLPTKLIHLLRIMPLNHNILNFTRHRRTELLNTKLHLYLHLTRTPRIVAYRGQHHVLSRTDSPPHHAQRHQVTANRGASTPLDLLAFSRYPATFIVHLRFDLYILPKSFQSALIEML